MPRMRRAAGSGKVKGVVSAGHRLTAEAGCRMLGEGGNAFDAALAASFASFVCEPVLTSPGGGGFFMAHTGEGRTTLYDFFTDVPGKGYGADRLGIRFFPVDIDFVGTVHELYVGEGSAAVPGVIAGLERVREEHCTLPLDVLLAPAVEYARSGVTLNFHQAQFLDTLSPMLGLTEEGRRLFFNARGEILKEGDVFLNRELGSTLEHLAGEGLQAFYTGDVAGGIVKAFGPPDGLITSEDLAGYRVIERKPLRLDYRGSAIYTNPPPSAGGALIAFALKLLEGFDLRKYHHNRAPYLKLLCEVMKATDAARKKEFNHRVHNTGEAAGFLSQETVDLYAKMLHSAPAAAETGVGNTTHISVIDRDGNAAAVTTSTGIGCGSVVPGTGIMMNNMLGEDDLNPMGFHTQAAGARLSSMMAPTIVMRGGAPQSVIGSGGSKRIRSAILQVILNLADHGLGVEEAVSSARAHWDGEFFQAEKGMGSAELEPLVRAGVKVRLWDKRHMYFGGTHVACRDAEGNFSGAGDGRRGGASIKVE